MGERGSRKNSLVSEVSFRWGPRGALAVRAPSPLDPLWAPSHPPSSAGILDVSAGHRNAGHPPDVNPMQACHGSLNTSVVHWTESSHLAHTEGISGTALICSCSRPASASSPAPCGWLPWSSAPPNLAFEMQGVQLDLPESLTVALPWLSTILKILLA